MSNDDAPDPQRLIRLARQTLSAAERRRKYQRIDFLGTIFGIQRSLIFRRRQQWRASTPDLLRLATRQDDLLLPQRSPGI